MKRPTLHPIVAGPVLVLALIAGWSPAGAETVELPSAGGGRIEMAVHLPPDFDPKTQYSVLVGPGDFYWQDRPSQSGWIVVVSDAFWGDHRIANSKTALTWLRKRYKPLHGGFHIAGWSANSSDVFEIATKHHKLFLSVTGIAGMPGRVSDSDLDSLQGVRIQFIVGEHDSYWRTGSERWFEKMRARGIEATLEIVPNGEHVMPEIANEPFFERMNRLVESLAN